MCVQINGENMSNERLLQVSFAHTNQIRGVAGGNRYFDVLHIGRKWVRIRETAKRHKNAKRITRITWDRITELKDFEIKEDNRG